MNRIRLLKVDDLQKGQIRCVRVADEDVLLARNHEGKVFAVEDRCSHDGGSFEDGALNGNVLTCPRHGAAFDIADGRALRMPAVAPIETFPARVTEDGWVEVEVEDDE